MANPALIAKAAAIVLTDERARKAIGWVLVAILSPLILLIAFLCSLGSGASGHNASAVEVCFNGAAIPASVPAEYRTCLETMRSSLALVDTAVSTINAQTEEGTSLDEVRVKAIFYALYFGVETQPEPQRFADCFVTYEERTRMVPVEGSDPPAQTEEKYTVAVPITDMGAVWQNIAASMGVTPTAEQRANADSIYSLVKYGWAGSGAVWSGDIGEPVLSVDGFCSPLGSGWQSRVTSEFGWRNCPYSVISDVSRTVVDLLRAELVPEPVAQAEQIGACDPHDRGNCVVGIHIYDISEAGEARILNPVPQPDGSRRNPPIALYLSMMISVSSKAEKETRTLDEQMIMGRVLQVLEDNRRLPQRYMPVSLRQSGESVQISAVPMELEEKTKIWTMFTESYKLSMFYKVGPVYLESAVVTEPARRVREVLLDTQQKERGT